MLRDYRAELCFSVVYGETALCRLWNFDRFMNEGSVFGIYGRYTACRYFGIGLGLIFLGGGVLRFRFRWSRM